jgi:HAD superfamily hydrolase (TIGR01509 family)
MATDVSRELTGNGWPARAAEPEGGAPRSNPMQAPALVIFDCDGVLVDSEHISHAVLQSLLAERGVMLTREETLERFMGHSMTRTLELVEKLTSVPPAEFLPRFRAATYQAFGIDLLPVAGVADLLARIRIPYCVASNGPREKMTLTLGKTGLLHRFAGRMFSADDVANPKPAPDLFLHAARSMGASPETCVVVEDSPTGVRAARAAGMSALGFAAITPAERLLDAGAAGTFTSMSSLPSLLELVGPAG